MSWEILIIVLLATALGVGFAKYWKQREELERKRGEEFRERDRMREKAGRLVEDARDKAVEIVREAEVLSERQEDDLERRLRRATRENVEEYAKEMKRMAAQIGKEAWSEVSDFKKALETGTLELEKTVAKRIGEEYDSARVEIAKYKEEKKAKLDAQAVEIVKELGRRVLGKVIPAEEHKNLIMEALKEVEVENGF